ncbi:MAG: ATP-binding protein [Yoonia sp.]|uniref:ATP-binding protein n=1 Tax=Yoonia sp. TaxID=2212373 RepID=UPI003EFAB0A6
MNPFIIPEIRDTAAHFSRQHYQFERSNKLQTALAEIFSRHLGMLQGGGRFEAEGLLVTGKSGSGKSTEVGHLVTNFNESKAVLPSGMPARIASCLLDRQSGWKGLGRKSAKALDYHIAESSRATQDRIWEKVVIQAKLQGVVGIHYDEVQHIFRKKPEADVEATIDSFKSLIKDHDWPLMLIFTGVDELAGYIQSEPQLFDLMTNFHFDDIVLPDDFQTIHEIVGSYAIDGKVEVAGNLAGEDFYKRLATAAAFRWGLLIKVTLIAIGAARVKGSTSLDREHFVDAWVAKTQMPRFVTPFTHDSYETMFRRDNPFLKSIED